MKKYQIAAAAAVTTAVVMAAAPAFAQFGGLLGAAAAARNNSGKANAATTAVAATFNAQTAFSSEGLPAPVALLSPAPMAGSEGKFMSPFKADGSVAEWATKAMTMKTGTVGSLAGNYAGEKLAEQGAARVASMVPIPGLGGLAARAGRSVGASAGRGLALQSIGGEAFVKSSSDLSFNTLQDLAVFMYVNHSTNPNYLKIAEATAAVYPEFPTVYLTAVQSASLK